MIKELSLFFIILSASSLFAGQTAQKMKEKVSGQKLSYLIHVPDVAAPADGWPMLLFLHGAGERGRNLEEVKVHGPPKLIDKFPELKNSVVVSPQCPRNSWWVSKTLMALVREVLSSHGKKINEQRIYVTGLSMGGYGSWDLISKNNDFFAAAAPICGGGSIERLKGVLKTKGAKPFDINDLIKVKDMPIWAFHGSNDKTVPQKESEVLVEALKEAGNKSIKFTSYKGVGHDSWTRTYNNPKFYKWLYSQERRSGG